MARYTNIGAIKVRGWTLEPFLDPCRDTITYYGMLGNIRAIIPLRGRDVVMEPHRECKVRVPPFGYGIGGFDVKFLHQRTSAEIAASRLVSAIYRDDS